MEHTFPGRFRIKSLLPWRIEIKRIDKDHHVIGGKAINNLLDFSFSVFRAPVIDCLHCCWIQEVLGSHKCIIILLQKADILVLYAEIISYP